jgi:hypothetical protein
VTKFQWLVIAVMVVAVVGGAWLFRYDVQSRNIGSMVYDRWTGTSYFCIGSRCIAQLYNVRP